MITIVQEEGKPTRRFSNHGGRAVRWAMLMVVSLLTTVMPAGCGPGSHPIPASLAADGARLGLTTRLPAGLGRVCLGLELRARRRRLKHPVICPALVPSGRITAVASGLAPTENVAAGYSIDALSQELPHASGGHWVFAAGG